MKAVAEVIEIRSESTWVHNETGVQLGSNVGRKGSEGQAIIDGGPTSWQAAILPSGFSANQGEKPFREFYFEFSDFQHAYEAGVYVGAGPDGRRVRGAQAAAAVRSRRAGQPTRKWPTKRPWVCPTRASAPWSR